MHALTIHYPLTVYFDGSCPLCTHEVQLLKRYDVQSNLQFTDCSAESFAEIEGYSRKAMMTLIHAQDAKGQWLIGAPVFAAAYQACGFAAIARLWGNAYLQPLWAIVYPWIARNRRWLSRLGASRALSWVLQILHAHAAKGSLARTQACAQKKCEIPKR